MSPPEDGQRFQKVQRFQNDPRFSTKVKQIRILSPEVLCVSLAVPDGFQWSPGQHVGVSDRSEGAFSYYSIASAPARSSGVDIELAMHGPSIKWAAPLALGTELYLSDAAGGPKLQDWHDARRLVLIGMGTGVAPLRSVARACLSQQGTDFNPEITLVQGARNLSNCLFYDEFMAWTASGLNYMPVLSQPAAADGWTGRTGYIQSHLDDLRVAGSRFCVCGKLEMVSEVVAWLVARGALQESVFAEGY